MSSLKKLVVSSIFMAGLASSFVNPSCAEENKSLVYSGNKKQRSKEKTGGTSKKAFGSGQKRRENSGSVLNDELLEDLTEGNSNFFVTVKKKLEFLGNLSEKQKQILKILGIILGIVPPALVATKYFPKKAFFENYSNKKEEIDGQKLLENQINEEITSDGKDKENQEENLKNVDENNSKVEKPNVNEKTQKSEKCDINENGIAHSSNNTKSNVVIKANKYVLYFGIFALYLAGVAVAALVEKEVNSSKESTLWVALSWLDVVGQSVDALVSRD